MDEARIADLGERLAEELDDARVQIEELAVELCLDPVVFERHAASLQRFDQVAQVIGEVARMIRERNRGHDAVKTIRLDAMLHRLEGARWADKAA